jgi:hypothetical protein
MSTDDINPDIIAEFEVVRTKMTAVDADAYFEVRMIDRMSKSAAAAERTAAAVETISEAMRDDHDEIAKIASVSKSIATVGERAAVSAGRSADAAIVIAAAVERISQHVGQIASSEIAPALTTIATAVDRMAIAAQAVEQIAHDVRAGLQAAAALAEEFGPTARRAARQGHRRSCRALRPAPVPEAVARAADREDAIAIATTGSRVPSRGDRPSNRDDRGASRRRTGEGWRKGAGIAERIHVSPGLLR